MIVVLGSALSIVLGAAAPTLAHTPPEHDRTIDIGWLVLPDIDCGTFTITETNYAGHLDKITYFDDAGASAWVVEHHSLNGVLTNTSTGATLRDKFDGALPAAGLRDDGPRQLACRRALSP